MIVVSLTKIEIMEKFHAYKRRIRMNFVLNILKQFISTKNTINNECSSVVLV